MKNIALSICLAIILGHNLPAFADASSCSEFKGQLQSTPGMSMGYVEVPKFRDRAEPGILKVFWWKRAGTNPQMAPLLLLHGGPGGNSWFFMDVFQSLFSQYSGDIFVIDERGDGCSGANEVPTDYKEVAHFRSREIVKDLETIRQKFYPNKKWRAFGQSRGSMILHYYLEMHPEGLESVHAHGSAFQTADNMAANYTRIRLSKQKELGELFLQLHPQAQQKIDAIRQSISPEDCWATNNPLASVPQICGVSALDLFSGYLSFRDYWDYLAQILTQIVPSGSQVILDKRNKIIQSLIPGNPLISHLSLEIGVYDYETSYLDYDTLQSMRNTPLIQDALFSEGRLMIELIMPIFSVPWTTSVDIPDFEKIRNFLATNPDFKFYLYSGQLDPIAPPELCEEEVSILSPFIQFKIFPNSGHDGFYTESLIQQRLLQ
jgi:pimeloyl-ACP methyl ester carboxylesterase